MFSFASQEGAAAAAGACRRRRCTTPTRRARPRRIQNTLRRLSTCLHKVLDPRVAAVRPRHLFGRRRCCAAALGFWLRHVILCSDQFHSQVLGAELGLWRPGEQGQLAACCNWQVDGNAEGESVNPAHKSLPHFEPAVVLRPSCGGAKKRGVRP